MKKGWSALHYALHVKNPEPSIIESFIRDSPNPKLSVNRLTEKKESPLTIALKNKTISSSIIKLLLENSANVIVKDNQNSYIFQTFLYDNSPEITSLFIDYGSVLTKKDINDLKNSELYITEEQQDIINCMKRESKKESKKESKLLDKYRQILVKLYQIDKRLIKMLQ
jgi:hypothetical protein